MHDEHPIRQKPIMYGAVEGLCKQMDKQVRLGVIQKLERGLLPEATFVSNIVLVWRG